MTQIYSLNITETVTFSQLQPAKIAEVIMIGGGTALFSATDTELGKWDISATHKYRCLWGIYRFISR